MAAPTIGEKGSHLVGLSIAAKRIRCRVLRYSSTAPRSGRTLVSEGNRVPVTGRSPMLVDGTGCAAFRCFTYGLSRACSARGQTEISS